MNYIKVYKAANSNEAYFIKGLLEQSFFKVKLLGENLSVAMGGLPLDVIQVDILVDKKNYKEAKKILRRYEKEMKNIEDRKQWICKYCSKHNPPSFEICWNCNK